MNLEFNKNEDAYKQLITQLKAKLKKVKLGGGEKKIEAQHAKGKLTARERIDYLIDNPEDFVEVGAFVGDGMYAEQGGCPSGGVVTGIGHVQEMCIRDRGPWCDHNNVSDLTHFSKHR